MNIKPIRNDQDYEEAILLLETLVESNPDPKSDDGDKLSILSTLVEAYEVNRYPQSLPSSIDAIKFRMEQANLKPADLVPYLGSRSKVSEILTGKRSLSLEMIRALEAGLGIPSKVLIQRPEADSGYFRSWNDPLLREMDKRGYFAKEHYDGKNKESLLTKFFGNTLATSNQLAWRKTDSRVSIRTDLYALVAWSEYIRHKASSVKTHLKYKDGVVNLAFMQEVIKLSSKDNGPLLAQEFLRTHGVVLVVATHLPKTKVDGVAILDDKERPIIGLSLRFDRLDNFWFTLLHELAHIALHLNNANTPIYFDELEDGLGINVTSDEVLADQLAQEAIIPISKWEISPAKITPSVMAADGLADELGIHVAVVAGYIRHKTQNYFYLRQIVNDSSARVRHFFDSQLNMKGTC